MVMEECDKIGKQSFLSKKIQSLNSSLLRMKSELNKKEFARKDYLEMFKDISTATATRDLKKEIEEKLWTKSGENRTTHSNMI